ncbi:hypothetical protein [Mariniblastus fucicola]|nr:hypothetical protein [Mariniblastus fucicola]
MLAKNYMLRNYEREQATTRFIIFIGAFTLVIWLVFPDPTSRHVRPAVKYVALPVAVFGVPLTSFMSYVLRDEKPTGFSIQDLAEFLFLPFWLIVCYGTIIALNWVWI